MKKQETYRFDSDDMLYPSKNSEKRGKVKYKNRNKVKTETRKILKEYEL